MGKFMRKSKLTSDVSLEIKSKSQSKSKSTPGVRTRAKTLELQRLNDQQDSKPDCCYLQLRSRRLEKPTLLADPKKQINQVRKEAGSRASSSGSIGIQGEEDGQNNLDFEPIQGATIRESTPADLLSNASNISAPGSSTILTNIPSTHMDDLFAHHQQQQQCFFMNKYNFDIVNDIPLPGRYEWVKVNP